MEAGMGNEASSPETSEDLWFSQRLEKSGVKRKGSLLTVCF